MNLIIILLTIFCNLSASQFWHAEKLSHSFSDKLSLTFEDDFRSKSFGENNYYFHGDIGLKYKLSSAIIFYANFREVFEKNSSGWVQEHRPHGGWTSLKVIPYFADEMFYDLSSNEINRNRFYIGCKIKNLTRIKPTIYFMQQRSLKNNEWDTIGVLGIKISF